MSAAGNTLGDEEIVWGVPDGPPDVGVGLKVTALEYVCAVWKLMLSLMMVNTWYRKTGAASMSSCQRLE